MIAPAFGSFSSPEAFVDAVLALKPRVAAFDCDGTLWFGDAGVKFFYWEIEQGLIPERAAQAALQEYEQYLAGRVCEDQMCGDMVRMHAGLPECRIREFAARFARANIVPNIFPEMENLVETLKARNCDVWAVSSTNNWVIEESVKLLGIAADRVLAVRVAIHDGVATDRLGEMTSGPGKARALKRVLPQAPDVSFGNAIFDLQMLELARQPFVVNPNPDLKKIAEERGWPWYQPAVVTSPTV